MIKGFGIFQGEKLFMFMCDDNPINGNIMVKQLNKTNKPFVYNGKVISIEIKE